MRARPMPGTSNTGRPGGVVRHFLLGILLAGASPAAERDWHVTAAPLRYVLHLSSSPTHARAGYFVDLPDGGILPGPYPDLRVVTESGGEVDSYLLWHNAESGLGAVFGDPGDRGRVYLYVAGTNRPRRWRPESGLAPGAILCTDPTKGSLSAARKLAELGRVGPTVHYRNRAGIPRAPLSIGGDPTGRPRPSAFYLLTHLVTTDPGRTWVAPFVLDGQCEVRIDGAVLRPKKRVDKWGGTGQWFDLAEGLHRLEVFAASEGTEGYFTKKTGGLMYLTWRTPNASPDELGGIRSENVPLTGTSRRETRVLRNDEIARSGRCRLEAVEARDGGPVACFRLEATQNFWFEEEDPVLVCTLEALTAGAPEDTEYVWHFPDGGEARGKSVSWLFPGWKENRATLAAVSVRGRSQCTQSFYGFTTVHSSLRSPSDRRAFREACLDMLEAYPARPDPAARWDDSYWKNFLRVQEFGKGYPLLRNLFGVRPHTARQRLTDEERMGLQDIFLDVAPRIDPQEALRWVREFHDTAGEANRRGEMKIREAEIHMYYLDDRRQAAQLLTRLARGTEETGQRARIRLGDLAFLLGDLERATGYYAQVEERNRRNRNVAAAAGGVRTADWKQAAVLEVSASETVGNLVAQGYLLEARQALRQWERAFPLSKVNSDYILQESGLYMRSKDWQRARAMLGAYCRGVDASSFLPDAAAAWVECMLAMGEPKEKVRETAEALRKRLAYHPVAKRLDRLLGGGVDGAGPAGR